MYYCIFADQSGLSGVPIFLEARIFEKQTKDPFNVKNSAYYDWMKPGFPESEFSDPLYLYTKNPKIDFDYYWFTSAFILSNEFLRTASTFTKNYKASTLHILPWKENSKTKVAKNYSYVKFDYKPDVIDFEKSVCDFTLDDKGNPIVHNGVLYVSQYHSLSLQNTVHDDLFVIKDVQLCSHMFCSEKFRQAAIHANLYGLLFIPLPEVIDFIKYNGQLGKENYERMKFGSR